MLGLCFDSLSSLNTYIFAVNLNQWHTKKSHTCFSLAAIQTFLCATRHPLWYSAGVEQAAMNNCAGRRVPRGRTCCLLPRCGGWTLPVWTNNDCLVSGHGDSESLLIQNTDILKNILTHAPDVDVLTVGLEPGAGAVALLDAPGYKIWKTASYLVIPTRLCVGDHVVGFIRSECKT